MGCGTVGRWVGGSWEGEVEGSAVRRRRVGTPCGFASGRTSENVCTSSVAATTQSCTSSLQQALQTSSCAQTCPQIQKRTSWLKKAPTLQEDLKLANTKAHVVVKIAHVVRLRCKKTSNLQIQKRTSSCKQRTARHHSPHLSPNHNHNQASGTRRRRGAQASHPRRTSCRAIARRSSLATDV